MAKKMKTKTAIAKLWILKKGHQNYSQQSVNQKSTIEFFKEQITHPSFFSCNPVIQYQCKWCSNTISRKKLDVKEK